MMDIKQIPEDVQVHNNVCQSALMVLGESRWPHGPSALPRASKPAVLGADEACLMEGCKSTLLATPCG